MSLAKRCLQEFVRSDRNKGRAYFQHGRAVYDTHYGPDIFFSVAGSGGDYDVILNCTEVDDGYLLTWCSCPRFADVGACKHVVASILKADELGMGSGLDGSDRLFVASLDDDDAHQKLRSAKKSTSKSPILQEVINAALGIRSSLLAPKKTNRGKPAKKSKPASQPRWAQMLTQLERSLQMNANNMDGVAPSTLMKQKTRQVWFGLDASASHSLDKIAVDVYCRESKKNGEFGKLKRLKSANAQHDLFPPGLDEQLFSLAMTCKSQYRDYRYGFGYYAADSCHAAIPAQLADHVLRPLCEAGRLLPLSSSEIYNEQAHPPLIWDDGPPWQFDVDFQRDDSAKAWHIRSLLRRDDQSCDLAAVTAVLPGGLAILANHLTHVNLSKHQPWIDLLQKAGSIDVPFADAAAFAQRLWHLPDFPAANIPDELRWEQLRPDPQPQIVLKNPKASFGMTNAQITQYALEGTLEFDYAGHRFPHSSPQSLVQDAAKRQVIYRNHQRETELIKTLGGFGFSAPSYSFGRRCDVVLPAKYLAAATIALINAGWTVEAEGARVVRPGTMRMSVASGVDWFDLDASIDFDGLEVGLPKLLLALRHGQQFVELGDGVRGMLPDEWLKKYGGLAELGREQDGKLRFVPSQAVFLDALLAAQPEAQVDKQFAQARRRLQSFEGVQPAHEPKTFVGELRGYQRDGLGWLNYLRDFGFGGCLADDMGLGKTIQVLALLEARRTAKRPKGEPRLPSLAVVPRSLVHNWIEEASRFAPALKLVDYTGQGRAALLADDSAEFDLLVTTYGTLRRDIGRLKDVAFEYAILDEAQAIKNSLSHSAKACRLLQARHRLAMTGTPIENHLGELWSLFEFLNPGMLGRSETFKRLTVGKRPELPAATPVSPNCDADFAADSGADPAAESSDDSTVELPNGSSLELLARAIRPFMLRRTKEQVLKELPEKTEQTLYCELDADQRKNYNQLRDHYRASLTKRIDAEGMNKSKMHVLEALLRLRQAACHPGLIDKAQTQASSAKLETLLEQLKEVLDGGHKALVFSQFTSLLAIVRDRCDREKIVYEYLDGKTRNRQAKVERFQNEADCKLFLISLKAGGLGLNLTAADYVFILDPWWNPAVESQAMDRAHRIGQTRRVFAYRLIARETVEEKIVQLQQSKRELADAIISADNSPLGKLTADDLRLLLS